MYDGLSDFYDMFMQEVDYSAWCDFAVQFIKDRKIGVDLGCGSGNFTLQLIKRGYQVIGADSSSKMLQKAYENAKKSGLVSEFVVLDAEKISFLQKKEFITAVCDVVNYIKQPKSFFAKAYDALTSDGILFFDISSDYKLKNILGNNTFSNESDGVLYVWNNYLASKRVDMELSFFRKDKDGRYTRFNEIQSQYIHSIDDIVTALNEVGFESVEFFGDFDCNKPNKKSERVFFVAKKGKV